MVARIGIGIGAATTERLEKGRKDSHRSATGRDEQVKNAIN
jgi:hypothetical protein